MIHLPHTLPGLADICAEESYRYSMSGVHVTDRGLTYELVATDGKRLLLVQGLNDERSALRVEPPPPMILPPSCDPSCP